MFWHLTPKKLECFYNAFRLKKRIQDEQAWMQGQYFYIAAYAATHNAIAGAFGKRGNAKYIEKPILQNAEEGKVLTEEEKQKAVDLFFAQEKARRVNWRRNHPKGGMAS